MQTGKEVKKRTFHGWRKPATTGGVRVSAQNVFERYLLYMQGWTATIFLVQAILQITIFFEQETSKNERLNEQDAYLLYYRLN